MNKFAIIAFFAILGCGMALADQQELDSQLALIPGNDEETSYLTTANKPFSQFCIEARDFTVQFMKSKANEAASSMYTSFFTSTNQIGQELLNSNINAFKDGASVIKQASKEVNQGTSQEEAAEKLTLFGRLRGIASAVIQTIVNTVLGELRSRVDQLKEQFTPDEIKEMINTVCRSVSGELTSNIESKLSAVKKALKAADSTVDRSTVTISNVGCVTASRIAKLSQFCNLITLCGPSLYPFLGL